MQLDLQPNIYYPIIINNIEYINDLAISNLPYKLDRRSNLEIISQRLVLVNQNTPYQPFRWLVSGLISLAGVGLL